eukprot:gene4305-4557_t
MTYSSGKHDRSLAQVAASQKDAYCAKTYKTKAACVADQTNRCYWDVISDPKKPNCSSSHVMELGLLRLSLLRLYGSDPAEQTFPNSTTCPGTLANIVTSCWSHADPGDFAAA